MARLATLVTAVVVLLVPATPGQDLLQRVRQATDSPAESAGDDRPRNKNPDACDSPDGDSLIGTLFCYALAAPVLIPPALLGDKGDLAWFPGHPYVFPDRAYLAGQTHSPEPAPQSFFDPERFKWWTARLSVEDGLLNSGVNRAGTRFAFDSAWRLGLTANADFLTERTSAGRSDQVMLGDVNLTWRFAQADWIQMRVGAGARGLFDRQRDHGGVNVLYGAEVFPCEPIVVAMLAEVGNLNDAVVTRLRASVGVQFGHAEFFAGYDWLHIGPVALYGPMLGLRLWF